MGIGVRWKVRQEGDKEVVDEIHKVVVHRFKMGDVDDLDIYIAEPLWKWQESDPGKFVMANAVVQPEWKRQVDSFNYGYDVVIVAELEKKKLSEFYLRWGKPK